MGGNRQANRKGERGHESGDTVRVYGHVGIYEHEFLASGPYDSGAHCGALATVCRHPIAEHLAKGRAMNGALMLQWWRDARMSLLQCLEHADPVSRIAWYGPSMGMRSFVTARLMETWAHGQDVCDALGVSREPTVRLRHIADLGVRTREFSYAVRGIETPTEEILVELTAPALPSSGNDSGGGGVWRWVAAGGGKVRDGGEGSTLPAQSGGSIRGSALDFCLIVTERRNLADVSLRIDGEKALEWMQIAQAFAGPPGPGRPPLPSS